MHATKVRKMDLRDVALFFVISVSRYEWVHLKVRLGFVACIAFLLLDNRDRVGKSEPRKGV